MQTFLPYSSFEESAKCLDNKRLGKQRVEAKQILEINLFKTASTLYLCENCKKAYIDNNNWHCDVCGAIHLLLESPENVIFAWENHPAVRMWRGYELALAKYGLAICDEWIRRGFKDNVCLDFFENNCLENDIDYEIEYPGWMTNQQAIYDFCYSHRANLMRKDPEFYGKYNWEFFGDYTKEPYKWNKEFWK